MTRNTTAGSPVDSITASSWPRFHSIVGRGSSSRDERPSPDSANRTTQCVRAILRVERTLARVVPLLLEVADPPWSENQRGPSP